MFLRFVDKTNTVHRGSFSWWEAAFMVPSFSPSLSLPRSENSLLSPDSPASDFPNGSRCPCSFFSFPSPPTRHQNPRSERKVADLFVRFRRDICAIFSPSPFHSSVTRTEAPMYACEIQNRRAKDLEQNTNCRATPRRRALVQCNASEVPIRNRAIIFHGIRNGSRRVCTSNACSRRSSSPRQWWSPIGHHDTS